MINLLFPEFAAVLLKILGNKHRFDSEVSV